MKEIKLVREDIILDRDELVVHVVDYPYIAQDIKITYRGKDISSYCTGIILKGINILSGVDK